MDKSWTFISFVFVHISKSGLFCVSLYLQILGSTSDFISIFSGQVCSVDKNYLRKSDHWMILSASLSLCHVPEPLWLQNFMLTLTKSYNQNYWHSESLNEFHVHTLLNIFCIKKYILHKIMAFNWLLGVFQEIIWNPSLSFLLICL